MRASGAWLRRAARDGLGVVGVGAVAVATAVFTSGTAYPGWASLAPTLGAVAIIAAGPSGVVGRVLSLRWTRRIGRLSFAWYLWHWPVLVLAEARLGELAWGWKAALVLASAVPAWLTMKLVEIPLRRSKALSVSPRPSLSFGATMVVVPLAIALVLGSAATRDMTNVVTTTALVGAVDGPNLTVVPGAGFTPTPLEARKDHPAVGDCQVEPSAVTSPPCRFGEGPDRIVLFGDSHAAQWFPVVQRIAAGRGWTVEVLTKSGCPVPMLRINNPQLGRDYRECDQWREYALQRISTGKAPRLIVVGTLNRYAANEIALKEGWAEPLRRLTATGSKVAYLRDTPFPAKDVPTCLSGALQQPGACDFPREGALWVDPVADEVRAGRQPGVVTVNVNDVLCPWVSCPTVLDGVVLYRDDAHLTNTAVTLLAPRIERSLVGLGVIS